MSFAFSMPEVQATFERFEPRARTALLQMRDWILEEGERLPRGVEETLKWGEPSYLGKKARVGTTVRIGSKSATHVALYVGCQTSLVDTFKELLGDAVTYEGNRAVCFDLDKPLPEDTVKLCARLAFRYHLDKRASTGAAP